MKKMLLPMSSLLLLAAFTCHAQEDTSKVYKRMMDSMETAEMKKPAFESMFYSGAPKSVLSPMENAGAKLSQAGYHMIFSTLFSFVGGSLIIASGADYKSPATFIGEACLVVSFGFSIVVPFDLISAGNSLRDAKHP